MIRMALRVRTAGVAERSGAFFVHGGRPTIGEALRRIAAEGASEAIVVPYAIAGDPALAEDLPAQLTELSATYPHISIRLAPPIGAHPAVAQVIVQRAAEADYMATHPMLARGIVRMHDDDLLRPAYTRYHAEDESADMRLSDTDFWRPLYAPNQSGLVLVAEASRYAPWNEPIHRLGDMLRRQRRYAAVRVVLLDRGDRSLPRAIAELAESGIHYSIMAPCVLGPHSSLHDRLPQLVAAARRTHPTMTVILAEHLAFDRRLVSAIVDRAAEARDIAIPPQGAQAATPAGGGAL